MSVIGFDKDVSPELSPRRPVEHSVQSIALSASLIALVALGIAVALTPGMNWQMLALIFVAALIGLSLQRASFGFSSAFRLMIDAGNAYGLRVHALMLIVASLAFLPLLSAGEFAGQPLQGFGAGIGFAFAIGALMFGIGMQISGGCASGTLFALGAGNGKPLATVLGFVIGSTIAAAQIEFWWSLPAFPVVYVQQALGLPLGLFVQIGALLLFFFWARPRAKRPYLDRLGDRLSLKDRLIFGPWPLIWGAIALALLNIATLILSGLPWGETSAFALWGSKILDQFGVGSVRGWVYWDGNVEALDRSLFLDTATIMDLGIILGAMAAAALSGRFSLHWGGNWLVWTGALIGGILMGYGARLSGGCNIGAYFSAGASGSISAWVWVVIALVGSAAGIRLRPLFGLDKPDAKSPQPVGC